MPRHDRLICLSTGKDLDDPEPYALYQAGVDENQGEMNELLPMFLGASNTLEILDKVE